MLLTAASNTQTDDVQDAEILPYDLHRLSVGGMLPIDLKIRKTVYRDRINSCRPTANQR